MGFFSNLMGQKLLGTVIIKFYDYGLNKAKASVEYETIITDKTQKENDLLQLFVLYYAKMLYNLNHNEHADKLIVRIQKTVENVLTEEGVKRVHILTSEEKLVQPTTDNVYKKYSGEFSEKSDQTRIVQTHMDAGVEWYYSPVSTVIFLQYLIDNLSEGSLTFLILTLGGMNKFYREVGDYSNIRSLTEAPNYGLNTASQILK